jgi:hypothetical protein
VLAALVAQVRRGLHRERTETLEATVAHSLEMAFRQFGREIEG